MCALLQCLLDVSDNVNRTQKPHGHTVDSAPCCDSVASVFAFFENIFQFPQLYLILVCERAIIRNTFLWLKIGRFGSEKCMWAAWRKCCIRHDANHHYHLWAAKHDSRVFSRSQFRGVRIFTHSSFGVFRTWHNMNITAFTTPPKRSKSCTRLSHGRRLPLTCAPFAHTGVTQRPNIAYESYLYSYEQRTHTDSIALPSACMTRERKKRLLISVQWRRSLGKHRQFAFSLAP